MSTSSTPTSDKDKSKRNRKRDCLTKIVGYFGDDTFYQFLLKKYEGHNDSQSWWKEVGLGIQYVVDTLGSSNITGPGIVKKAFSDALLSRIRSDKDKGNDKDKEKGLVLARKHMLWIKKQPNPGSTALEEYAKWGYHIGTDGMIAEDSTLKRKRQDSDGDESPATTTHSSTRTRRISLRYRVATTQTPDPEASLGPANPLPIISSQNDGTPQSSESEKSTQPMKIEPKHAGNDATLQGVDERYSRAQIGNLEDTAMVDDPTGLASIFTDSQQTSLLPSFMAVDVREATDIKTALPGQVCLMRGQSPAISDLWVPVGQLYNRASAELVLNANCTHRRTHRLSGSTLYVFYDQSRSGNPAQVYFGLERCQSIDRPIIAQLAVSWFSDAQQCTTEDGRIDFLHKFWTSCNQLQDLNNIILRDRAHANLIQARRSQLRFCEDEWAAANGRIFRPTFNAEKHLSAASDWVDEQTRRKILTDGIMLHGHPRISCTERWSLTQSRDGYVSLPAIRDSHLEVNELIRRLDKLVISYLENPEISEFIVRATLQWLQRAKSHTGKLAPDVDELTTTEIVPCLKLFAAAAVYVAARQSQGSSELFNTVFSSTTKEPAKRILYGAQLADRWTYQCYEIIGSVLEQISRADIHNNTIPLNDILNAESDTLSRAKKQVKTLTNSLVILDLPAGLSFAQLSCNDSLGQLASEIARLVNHQSSTDPLPGFQESFPAWQHGFLFCDHSIYRQLPAYAEKQHLVWPDLRGAELEDAVIRDLEERIQTHQASFDEGLKKLLAPRERLGV